MDADKQGQRDGFERDVEMKMKDFDFGAEDARNLLLLTELDKQNFLKSFVLPETFNVDHFLEGRKYFVYGGKGSGKTALLQYIRIVSEINLNAFTSFYYFQSTFSEKELYQFREKVSQRSNEEIINDTVFSAEEDAGFFWRIFILEKISKMLRRQPLEGDKASIFFRSVEAVKLISRSSENRKKYPSLEAFHLELSKNPNVTIDGKFHEAGPGDLITYIELAEDALDDIYLQNSPIFLFIDEMEIYKRGDFSDQIQVAAISSLIRSIRDFAERFPSSDIRAIAAVRQEIIEEVAEVKYETHRIVRDKGVELDWPKSVKEGPHPLERTIINRIAVQDEKIDTDDGITDDAIRIVKSRYFEGGYPSRLIDNTWYRPRDMALMFEIAQTFDGSHERFRKDTLVRRVLADLGTRLWQDAKSGLAVKYDSNDLSGIDRLLRGGRREYTRPQWIERISILRDQDNFVAGLDDRNWEDILKSLYRVGVVFYKATESGYRNHFFRGDPMPTFTDSFTVGIHKTLWNELGLT